MRRISSVVLMVTVGFLLLLPAPAKATLVTIDEILCQTCSANLAGTADFSVVGNTLTIVLTNTSTGATGGAAATNLLAGIGFNLPTGVTISNNGATNAVALTAGSINIGGVLSDTTWGAGNGALSAINILTLLGDVNAAASTLQAQADFDLAGATIPPGNVDGPDFGLLSNVLAAATCGAGLACEQNSLTLTLLLGGTVNAATLIAFINDHHVVLSFGSPTPQTVVPEPSTLLLVGTALLGLGYSIRNRIFRRSKEHLAAA